MRLQRRGASYNLVISVSILVVALLCGDVGPAAAQSTGGKSRCGPSSKRDDRGVLLKCASGPMLVDGKTVDPNSPEQQRLRAQSRAKSREKRLRQRARQEHRKRLDKAIKLGQPTSTVPSYETILKTLRKKEKDRMRRRRGKARREKGSRTLVLQPDDARQRRRKTKSGGIQIIH